MTETNGSEFIDNNRPLKNETFRTALRTYMKRSDPEKLNSVIQSRKKDLLNTILFMKDDEIKDQRKSKLNYCLIFQFCIILISACFYVLQQYIENMS